MLQSKENLSVLFSVLVIPVHVVASTWFLLVICSYAMLKSCHNIWLTRSCADCWTVSTSRAYCCLIRSTAGGLTLTPTRRVHLATRDLP